MSPRVFHRRPARDDGFSVVEVLVAALILTLTATAIAVLLNSANHNTFRAEGDQVVVNRLQNEMERIRQLPFSQVALTVKPTSSNQAGDPAERVSADGTHFDLNRNGTNTRTLAYAGGATPDGKPVGCGATGQPACGVNPGPEPFQSGDVSGKIYRYVAYPGVPVGCPGCSADYFKRIIVIIQLDTTPAGGAHVYQEIQSNFSSPDAVPSNNPVPPCDQSSNDCSNQQIATFWLTDTPCTSTSRIAPTTSHATHNTRGTCTDGQNGTPGNPPDLMLTDSPAAVTSDPVDYSTDVQRQDNPRFGLAMLRTESTPGCAAQVLTGNPPNQTLDLSAAETTPQLKIHTWLTNELNSTFGALTTADASVEIWTKSVGGAAYQGRLCVYVFKRITVSQQVAGQAPVTFAVDTPAIIGLDNPYLQISKATWDQQWTRESTGKFDLKMLSVDDILAKIQAAGTPGAQYSLVGQPRLGLALTVDQQGTSGNALEVMYDQQTFDSRFELDTPNGTCIVPCS
jgi:Tfp pilus assembly protein PilV